jgi:hypothetical protein
LQAGKRKRKMSAANIKMTIRTIEIVNNIIMCLGALPSHQSHPEK